MAGGLLLSAMALFGTSTSLAAPPGAIISNQAALTFEATPGVPSVVLSNEVQLVTAVLRSPAEIQWTRVVTTGTYQEPVGPAACFQSGVFVNLSDPILSGGMSIDPSLVQDVSVARSFNLGEPLFIRLVDADQNLDFAIVDTAIVAVVHDASGDTETIRLTETGPDTGVFAGYVPSVNGLANSGDCVLQGSSGTQVRVTYTDPADAADSAQALAELDPISIVFDSLTGAPVNGATIELVDAANGSPAIVFGNDGISTFPSIIDSGMPVTDSGGTTYSFSNGEFRFPNVSPGNYRLVVSPPADYFAPSSVDIATLQLLPNAPFRLGPESFGSNFTHDGGGPFVFDYPIDPQSTSLFLAKSTMTSIAALGDRVRYEIAVENRAAVNPANAVQIIDRLPNSLRYVPGSAKMDGVSIADPVIDGATMQLSFLVGDLAAGQRVVISYVVEIVSGARNQEIVNIAIARSTNGLVSNESEARFRLIEELFRSTSTLIGRVVNGSCEADQFSEDQGVSGVRIYLEDGRYAVTDAGGRFHFEGLKPGTHVAQMDRLTIPDYLNVRECKEQARFAGRGDSQFVELARGSLMRADFYLQRNVVPEGRVNIELTNTAAASDQEVVYEVTLSGNGNIAVNDVRLVVLLPDGISFVPGSAIIDGVTSAVPRKVGQSLTFNLDDQHGDWRKVVRFNGVFVSNVTGGLRARALARFNSPVKDNQQTPIAETLIQREGAVSENEDYVLNLKFDVMSAKLAAGDRVELEKLIRDWRGINSIQIAATGHSDSTRIAPANRHIFADNYLLSKARALAVANYVAAALNVSQDSIRVAGRGSDDPVASNATEEGRQQNRRVDLVLSGNRPVTQAFLRVSQASSGLLITKTRGMAPGSEDLARDMRRQKLMDEHLTPPVQVDPHINSLSKRIAWVTPEVDFRPSIPAMKIAVSHAVNQRVILSLNGLPVNPLNFDGIEMNTTRTVAVSRWAGVDLVNGENLLTADVIGPNGETLERLQRSVHYAGAAVRGEMLEELSTLIADGKTRPVLAFRFFDRFGKPARHASIGAFKVNQPYRSWWQVQDDQANKLVTLGSREPLYTIGRDGIAYLELEPTTDSGMVTVTLKFENQREQEVRSYLTAATRDWIMVGFGEGMAGYNTLKDNSTAAMMAGHEDGYFDDGRLAFFAKGSIKGEYLLTIAYDSAREKSESQNRFLTTVDPNAYYTLYADNSEQRFEAPSQSKLYVKLERGQFVAMFGDFHSGLTTTELSRYERRFNGFKSEYHGKHIDYSVFASETDQTFVRDEIQGDGTSGLYRLSTVPIIGNSETIRIEVRDRFDSAIVLSSQTLNRFLDYNLDIYDGTLFFKKPIPSRDQDFNLIYIVAEYESRSTAANDLIAGGRIAFSKQDDTLEVGVTHVNDSQRGEQGDLTGVDLRWQMTDRTQIRAEIATSNNESGGVQQSGDAHGISIDHRSERLDLRAYYRTIDDDFGLGQQSVAAKGISKFGIDGRYELSEFLSLNAQAAQQENLETGTERLVAEADVHYQNEVYSAQLGIVHARDAFTDGVENTSDIVTVGVSRRILGSKMNVRANSNFALGDDSQNADYPANYVLGIDYEVVPGVDVFAEYENAEGRDIRSEMTRVGVRASPWSRAHFDSSLTNEMTEFGPRLFANLGLIQGFQVNEQWAIDIGIDQTSTLSDPAIRTLDPDREFASGSRREDFFATSFGTLYQSEFWSLNSRIEYRDSDSEQRTGFIAGWYRESIQGHGLSAGLAVHESKSSDSTRSLSADLRFGWARRPANSNWTFLDRVDLVYDDEKINGSSQRSWRLINNFNANRRLSASSQIGLQYAFKYVQTNFGGEDYSGYTDLIGLDLRRGFKQKWEAGLHTSAYHSYESSIVDYGFGLDLGWNVRDNMWITLGYNIAGFHDGDFAEARYTAQGPYLRVSIKADQETLKRIAGR